VKNILFIRSSPRDSQSYSRRVARSIVYDLTKRYRDAKVTDRNLADSPPPHVGSAFVGGLAAAPPQQTPQQAEALALSPSGLCKS
jgi:FMN-dependent NADH-azoreductase